MEDLVEFEKRTSDEVTTVPREAREVHEEWVSRLRHHPDSRFREYIQEGIRHGFRIGFQYGDRHCKRAKRNMQSASRTLR